MAIIGAGVVGTAIARELACRTCPACSSTRPNDVGAGTSKANTAILHTGFDAVPGSLEARLCAGATRCSVTTHIAPGYRSSGPGRCWSPGPPGNWRNCPRSRTKPAATVSPTFARSAPGELYRREPHLGRGALGALAIPEESIVCPWTTPLAYATQALAAGARLRLRSRVTGIRPGASEQRVVTSTGVVRCRWVVNAAGLNSDVIDAMIGGRQVHHLPAPRRADRVRQAGPAAAVGRSCCR